ncbi:MAG: hypothetical protein VKQ33_16290 [Candidatus Sericytochromatia bacterium]|nr:hypothetical protein [Candidatus Sericytochromatia bacterium]
MRAAKQAPPTPIRAIDRERRLAITVGLVRQALAVGEPLRSLEVQRTLGVSRPTALRYMRAAQAAFAQEQVLARPGAASPGLPAVLPAQHPHHSSAYLTRGLDLTGQLQSNAQRLDRISRQLEADLAQVRFWLFGSAPCPPELCVGCGQHEAEGLRDRPAPPGLTVKDLAALASALIKSIRELNGTVEVCTRLLGQIYTCESMERFSLDVSEAIAEVCTPGQRQAIAGAIRRRAPGGC